MEAKGLPRGTLAYDFADATTGEAVKELTKICGWAQPTRLELSATDTLAEFVNSIREAGGARQRATTERGAY